MTRAERRHRFQRAVQHAYHVVHNIWQTYKHLGWYTDETGQKVVVPIDEHANARRMAEVHCRPCSCWMCAYQDDYKQRSRSLKGDEDEL